MLLPLFNNRMVIRNSFIFAGGHRHHRRCCIVSYSLRYRLISSRLHWQYILISCSIIICESICAVSSISFWHWRLLKVQSSKLVELPKIRQVGGDDESTSMDNTVTRVYPMNQFFDNTSISCRRIFIRFLVLRSFLLEHQSCGLQYQGMVESSGHTISPLGIYQDCLDPTMLMASLV